MNCSEEYEKVRGIKRVSRATEFISFLLYSFLTFSL